MPCLKKARVAPSVAPGFARPSYAVKKETDGVSDDDCPISTMLNGVNCLPQPNVPKPSASPYLSCDESADPGGPRPTMQPSCGAGVATSTRVEAAPSRGSGVPSSTHVAPSRGVGVATSTHVEAAPSSGLTCVGTSTRVEEAGYMDRKSFRDAKDKANEFNKQLRRAPHDVRAHWESTLKDKARFDPERYAFGLSTTTCNTHMLLVVTCDCCFVGIDIMTCDCRLICYQHHDMRLLLPLYRDTILFRLKIALQSTRDVVTISLCRHTDPKRPMYVPYR